MPALAWSWARREAASTTRVTRTRRMLRVAWLSMTGRRSMAKPGLTPVASTTTPVLRQASSILRARSPSSSSGLARFSHEVTTCVPLSRQRSSVGRSAAMSLVVDSTVTSGRARESMAPRSASIGMPTRPSPRISPRSRPALAGSASTTPTSRTRGSSIAALATSQPTQPKPTTPMRTRSGSLATGAS